MLGTRLPGVQTIFKEIFGNIRQARARARPHPEIKILCMSRSGGVAQSALRQEGTSKHHRWMAEGRAKEQGRCNLVMSGGGTYLARPLAATDAKPRATNADCRTRLEKSD